MLRKNLINLTVAIGFTVSSADIKAADVVVEMPFSPNASEIKMPESHMTAPSAAELLEEKKQETIQLSSAADQAIKYGLVGAGAATGLVLAHFYGPALAATAAYKGTLALANAIIPNQSALTYYLFTKPAAIDAAVYVANSTAVQAGIKIASSGLGYVLGKAATSAYEGVKIVAKKAASGLVTAVKATAGAMESGWNWFKSKIVSPQSPLFSQT